MVHCNKYNSNLIWKCIFKYGNACLQGIFTQNNVHYIPGIEELRVAIRDFHNKYDGISFSADDVIVGPGSKELIFLLMNIFQGGSHLLKQSNISELLKTFILFRNINPN